MIRKIDMRVEQRIEGVDLNPSPSSHGAAGYDLRAAIETTQVIYPQQPAALIPTGVFFDMNGYRDMAAVVLPRSGLGHKKGLVLGNGVGLIDSDYQGEIFVSAWNRNALATGSPIVIEPGDRIAQLVFLPVIHPFVNVVDRFVDDSVRGAGGFGSTGVG